MVRQNEVAHKGVEEEAESIIRRTRKQQQPRPQQWIINSNAAWTSSFWAPRLQQSGSREA